MITRSALAVQTESIDVQQKEAASWQEILSAAITSPADLLKTLHLSPELLRGATSGHKQFQIRVPHTYIARIRPGDPDDPLLRQVLPVDAELDDVPGFSTDPLAEQPKNSQRGIIHKYQGRLLLLPGQVCGINCRFCFRRHFPYEDNTLNREEWQHALDYIRNDNSLTEVILSGGDPLAQNDKRLAWLIEQLADIPHLQRLRIHSRLPVVIPQRVTQQMIDWLTSTRLQPVLVVHCNHPQEISDDMTQGHENPQGQRCTTVKPEHTVKGR